MRRVLASKGVARLAGVFALLIIAGMLMRDRLESVGLWFTDRFGVTGMAVGTFLADAIQFPIPPQFYMLAAVMSDMSPWLVFGAICAGSLAGGFTAYWLARHLSDNRFVRRWFISENPEKFRDLLARRGKFTAIAAAASPIPFSTQCVVAGLYHVSYHLLFFMLLLRIPRLAFFYFVIREGWRLSA